MMFKAVMTTFLIKTLYDLLKSSLLKELKQPVLQKAVSETAREFKDIEGIDIHLEKWLEQEETQKALEDFLNGKKEEIDIEYISRILVERVGFYYGQQSQERANEIIQTFWRCFHDQLLKSEEGLAYAQRLNEIFAQRDFAEHEETQKLIKDFRGELTPLIRQIALYSLDETKERSDAVNKRIGEAAELIKLNKPSEARYLLFEVVGEMRGKLEFQDELARVYNNLGVTFNSPGSDRDFDEAIKYFNAALELKPTFVKAKMNLAATHLDRGTKEVQKKI